MDRSEMLLPKDAKSGGLLLGQGDQQSEQEKPFSPLRTPLWKHSVDCRATLWNSRRIVPNCPHPKRLVFSPPKHFGKYPDFEPVLGCSSSDSQGKKQGGSSSVIFGQRLNSGPAEEIVSHVVYDDVGEVPGRQPSDLEFESKFESGNLQRSVRIGKLQYDLVLRPDLNTGACQWYYFMVRNMQKGETYRFNVVNLYKEKSMYRRGLLPLLWSEKDAENNSTGWRRAGRIIGYDENRAKRKGGGCHYTLSFQMEFPWEDDCCFVAMCYPYTYTDLYNFLGELCAAEPCSEFLQRSLLCETPCGYSCELLTITASASAAVVATRKAFVITARVHPGESNSSWINEGMVRFLTGSSNVARSLREAFVFYIVPMVNPGGVIHGYYRVSNLGYDLNRQWTDPKEATQSTIFHVKKLIQSLTLQRRLLMFCDVHGHSSKPNTFMYGCNSTAFGSSLFGLMDMHRQGFRREQTFPKHFSELCPAMSFKDCKFQVDKTKESTGRGVVFKEFGIVHSYTLEASFLGLETPRDESGSLKDGAPLYTHFNPTHLQDIGAQFIVAIADYAASGTSGWELASEHCHALAAALRDYPAASQHPNPPSSDVPQPKSVEEGSDRTCAPPRASPPNAQRAPPNGRNTAGRRPPRPQGPSSQAALDGPPLQDASAALQRSVPPPRRSRETPRAADSQRVFAHRRGHTDLRVASSSSRDNDTPHFLSAAAPPATTVLANPRRRGLSVRGPLPSAVKGTAVSPVRLRRAVSSSTVEGRAEEVADTCQVKARPPAARPLARAKSAASMSAQQGQDDLGGVWMRVLPAPMSTTSGRGTPRSALVEREVVVYGGRGRLKLGRPATALLGGTGRAMERAASVRGGRGKFSQAQSPAVTAHVALEGDQREDGEDRARSEGGEPGCLWRASAASGGRVRGRPASASLPVSVKKSERLTGRGARNMSS